MNEEEKKKEEEEKKSKDNMDNFKAEMNRKMGNTETQLDQLKKMNEQLVQELQINNQAQQQRASAQYQEPTKSLNDLWYEDPQKAVEMIQIQTEQRVMERVEASQARQNKQNVVIGNLMSEYPELSDANHELTKKVSELYELLPAEEKNSPLAYKIAARDAAAELGILPKSKRKEDTTTDSFTVSSSSGSTRPAKSASDEVDQRTTGFAEHMGLDTSDPKVMESLKARQDEMFRKQRR